MYEPCWLRIERSELEQRERRRQRRSRRLWTSGVTAIMLAPERPRRRGMRAAHARRTRFDGLALVPRLRTAASHVPAV